MGGIWWRAPISAFEQSEKLQNEVVSVQRRLLGEGNDRTLLSVNNPASLYMQMGRYSDAEPLLTKTVSILRSTLGEAHPSTLLAMSNLGSTYYGQGKLAVWRMSCSSCWARHLLAILCSSE